jgi:uncharacterized Zn finger protein
MFIEEYCPGCDADEEQEVLSESHDLLVRCVRCGQIHHVPRTATPGRVIVRSVVSAGQTSRICTVELGADEECRVGDHLVAECGEDCTGVEVTGIEAGPRRVPVAPAAEISTLWTRVIESVVVKISVHKGWETIPLIIECAGEEPFIVGEIYTVDRKKFRITHIKLRDGALLRKEGWTTVAQKIKRVYGTIL